MKKALIQFFIRLFGSLPLWFHRGAAHLVAFLIFRVVGYRVKVVKENLQKAFPDKTDAQREQIARRFYLHFGEIVTEAIWFGACRGPKRLVKSGLIKIEGLDEILSAGESGKSVMVMSSHSGNWELTGGFPPLLEAQGINSLNFHNCTMVYKRVDDPVWDRVMQENRWAPVKEKLYEEANVETTSAIRYILSHRDVQKYYFLITDQRPYRVARGSVDVNFLGVPCTSMDAAANLAKKFDMPLVYMGMRREDKHYVIFFKQLLADPSTKTAQEIMQMYYDQLSADIQAQPWNYLWTHRRWK